MVENTTGWRRAEQTQGYHWLHLPPTKITAWLSPAWQTERQTCQWEALVAIIARWEEIERNGIYHTWSTLVIAVVEEERLVLKWRCASVKRQDERDDGEKKNAVREKSVPASSCGAEGGWNFAGMKNLQWSISVQLAPPDSRQLQIEYGVRILCACAYDTCIYDKCTFISVFYFLWCVFTWWRFPWPIGQAGGGNRFGKGHELVSRVVGVGGVISK